jgi:hypothetical protein
MLVPQKYSSLTAAQVLSCLNSMGWLAAQNQAKVLL